MADDQQCFPVPRALVNSDVPLGVNGGEDAQRFSRVRPSHVGEMAEDAAMRDVVVRMMGGKRRRLERERGDNQQQYRKRFYVMAAKLHKRLHYTSRFGGAKPMLKPMAKKKRIIASWTNLASYDAPAPTLVTEFSRTGWGPARAGAAFL